MIRTSSQYFSVSRYLGAARIEVGDRIVATTRTLVSWLADWGDLARQRRALSRLDDRLLRDVGIGRAEAERESRRWSVALRWRDRLR